MQPETTSHRLDALTRSLQQHNQAHLLEHQEMLDADERSALLTELETLDLDEIGRLASGIAGESTTDDGDAPNLEPAPYITRDEAAAYRKTGEDLIAGGGVAAFTVAGGQGTRLGWNGPKGTFPATPITGKPLFQVFAEQIVAAERKYGVEIPWYVMTSPLNDAATRSFFADNNFFGKAEASISMFPQGVMPAVDFAGRLLMEDATHLAVSPDGHGGSLRALRRSGSLEDMQNRGITAISYFQVDNPNVHVLDPLFLGAHVGHPDSSGEMSSKMVPKAEAGEKVGVFCKVGDRVQVIEYSDLDPELAAATDAEGRLRFLSGSIALHVLGVEFVDRLTAPGSTTALPFHQARKKVPCWNSKTREAIKPTEPNGIKFEMFVFDALEFAERSIVLETDRVEEFAPIKNAEGTDSARTSQDLQVERAARWIESVGRSAPRSEDGTVDATIEIKAQTALSADDLDPASVPEITPGDSVLF